MFNIDLIEITQTEKTNCGSFLQTPFWCEFKSRHGWQHKRFNVKYTLAAEQFEQICEKKSQNNDLHKEFETEVLIRSFFKNIFSVAYIPLMPDLPFECTDEDIINKTFEDDNENPVSTIDKPIITAETQTIEFANLLYELAKALKPKLPKNTIVIRFDPNVSFSNIENRDLFNFGLKTVAFADRLKLKKNAVDIQPPDTTVIDLTKSEDEILSKMHSKWRYNIRLSEKKGVKIEKYDGNILNLSEKTDIFYELTKETNRRDGNSSHSKEYYFDLINNSAKEIAQNKDVPLVNLYIASHEDDKIAAIIVLFSRDEAVYLYGASSDKKRNVMPNYLLQWTAIKDAKNYGSKIYDFYGMPPEGKDENHPMHGLYMFKANFGGKVLHRIGSWNVPLKKIYSVFAVAEKIRAFWYKKIVKKLTKKSKKRK